ncbi:MAG: hypothetical protein IJ511_04365 [Bacteroides sp.]|nr:hypothetical protein [Bacteroides sp.]
MKIDKVLIERQLLGFKKELEKKIDKERIQWNILYYDTKEILTMTIGSFLFNKIWAWLDNSPYI